MKLRSIFTIALAGSLVACAPDGATHKKTPGKLVAMSDKEQHMIQMAEATRSGGDPDMAADFYRKAIDASDGNITAHMGLASLMRAQNKPTEALAALSQAEKLQPDNGDIWREEGNTLIALNKPEEAMEKFTRSLELSPGDARSYNGKGVALDMLGRHDEAQATYNQGIQMFPQDSGYIENNLALSYLAAKRYDDAIALLGKLAALPEASATVRQNLALAYGLNGELDLAAEVSKQDLTPEQIARNQRFYEHYLSHKDDNMQSSMAVPTQAVIITPLSPTASVPTHDVKPQEPQMEAHPDYVTTARFRDGEHEADAASSSATAPDTSKPAKAEPLPAQEIAEPQPEPEDEPVKAQAVAEESSGAPDDAPRGPVVQAPGKTKPGDISVVRTEVVTETPDVESPAPAAGAVVAPVPSTPKKLRPAVPESKIIIAPQTTEPAAEDTTEAAPVDTTKPEEAKESAPVQAPRKTTPADF